MMCFSTLVSQSNFVNGARGLYGMLLSWSRIRSTMLGDFNIIDLKLANRSEMSQEAGRKA